MADPIDLTPATLTAWAKEADEAAKLQGVADRGLLIHYISHARVAWPRAEERVKALVAEVERLRSFTGGIAASRSATNWSPNDRARMSSLPPPPRPR